LEVKKYPLVLHLGSERNASFEELWKPLRENKFLVRKLGKKKQFD
jgi:hypothetical protein